MDSIYNNAANNIVIKELLARAEYGLPKPGQILEGAVISSNKNMVLVDLGMFGIGVVYPGEFYDNPDLQKSIKKGQNVSAILLEVENADGYRELSLKRAQVMTAWEYIRGKKESGEIITTKVININKGGLIVEISGIQGFLPLSQLAPNHYPKVGSGNTSLIVQALQKFRGQDFQIRIIDYSETDNKLIVSEKAAFDDKLKEKIAKLKVGDTVSGTITDVTDFGAFVAINIPGEPATEANPETPATDRLEGLIHISEIDWKIVENPRDFLAAGQEVQAKITNIEGTKVSLSLKALKADPWANAENTTPVGTKTEGEVVKVTNYGLLVSLPNNILGLIPAAELNQRKPEETPKLGQKVPVAIISIDPADHKMLLTLLS
ncbi:MAG: 30S ribosomal protein S1 [Parcubacteria group bacterium Licking1014_17]|nr:MAG: 30S ribosomal protein S1 [Parcubacteria group bacterium Licking1014_17]